MKERNRRAGNEKKEREGTYMEGKRSQEYKWEKEEAMKRKEEVEGKGRNWRKEWNKEGQKRKEGR